MNAIMFPVDLQKRFEEEIIHGSLPVGQRVDLSGFQKDYQAEGEDSARVLRSSYRKGLLSQDRDGAYTVLGKSQSSVRSVFQHAAASGLAPKSVVRALKVIHAQEAVAQHLQVEIGQPVFCQTRTRLVNDEVVANQNNFIPVEVCPTLEDVDLSQRSFQVTLNEEFHTVITDIEEKHKITAATGEDAVILGLEDGEDVLVVNRLSLCVTGLPVVWADIHVRMDRFHYVEALWPQAALLLKQGR